MKKLLFFLAATLIGLSGHYLVSQYNTNKQTRTVASTEKGEWSFKFNAEDFKKNTGTNFPDKEFTIKVTGSNWDEAYKKASKKCFEKLTGGTYPGESRGMDIIDICANPR